MRRLSAGVVIILVILAGIPTTALNGHDHPKTEKDLSQTMFYEQIDYLGEAISNFGGVFKMGDVLNVYVKGAQPVHLSDDDARLIATALGIELPEGGVRVVPAEYTVAELSDWYEQLGKGGLLAQPYITAHSKSGRNNRLYIGVASPGDIEKAQEKLRELGVPAEAVAIEVFVVPTGD